ncbi:Cyclic nucleotide-binding protein [Pseudocohnilembus persalinus]|uniref:Cyclic nucleotide-binding protein n=1 Tax=Pseudocohnilembus persalinus TaxID=266149 RepID=A0A0V0R9N2_PSEPJ|nr:Cyclic nucleotide-binding protein [Pseudocohnilembus persalinus]|eukprot:KRX11104.1 Cyclic nucleotide-binding protein [Pseudocohnilembus persalinus]
MQNSTSISAKKISSQQDKNQNAKNGKKTSLLKKHDNIQNKLKNKNFQKKEEKWDIDQIIKIKNDNIYTTYDRFKAISKYGRLKKISKHMVLKCVEGKRYTGMKSSHYNLINDLSNAVNKQKRFLMKYYWVTVGYGDITPTNTREKIYCIFMTLISCGVFAYAVNTIGQIIITQQQKSAQQKRDKYILNTYMSSKNINKNLQIKMQKYLDFKHQQVDQNAEQAQKILAKMIPKNLRDQFYEQYYGSLIRNSPFLHLNFSKKVQIHLSYYLLDKLFVPGEYLFKQNDNPEYIYILLSGKVDIIFSRDHKQFTAGSIQQVLFEMKHLASFTENRISYCFSCQLQDHDQLNCPLISYNPNKLILVKKTEKIQNNKRQRFYRAENLTFSSLIDNQIIRLITRCVRINSIKEQLKDVGFNNIERLINENLIDKQFFQIVPKYIIPLTQEIGKYFETITQYFDIYVCYHFLFCRKKSDFLIKITYQNK